eukprot:6848964-Lingulodinium_polyedra.AAC.1
MPLLDPLHTLGHLAHLRHEGLEEPAPLRLPPGRLGNACGGTVAPALDGPLVGRLCLQEPVPLHLGGRGFALEPRIGRL